jgi:hypothetical protein
MDPDPGGPTCGSGSATLADKIRRSDAGNVDVLLFPPDLPDNHGFLERDLDVPGLSAQLGLHLDGNLKQRKNYFQETAGQEKV